MVFRFFWRWMLLGTGLCWQGAALATHLPENFQYSAVLTVESIDALDLVHVSSTLRSAQAAPQQRYQPFDTHTTYPLNVNSALWLRIRLQALAPIPGNGWVLAMPKPFFDAIEIYTYSESQGPNHQSGWQMQTAGGAIAHQDWPIQSLSPQFYLPAMAQGSHEVYLKIWQDLPTRMSFSVQPIAQAFAEGQKNLLMVGLSLGIVAVMLAWSAVLAFLYRKSVYAWYAVYTCVVLLFVASYTGFASYAFWPTNTIWSRHGASIFAMGSVATQLQFARALLLPQAKLRWLHHAITLVVAGTVVGMVLYFHSEHVSTQLALLAATLIPGLLFMVLLGLRALRQRATKVVARLWLLAYVPIVIVLTLTLVELLGIAPLAWLPLNAPVYALLFEVPVLLATLHFHAKSLRDNEVRERTLAETDPLTGFANQAHFQRMLSMHWTQYQLTGQDVALAYIKLVHQPGQSHREELQRVVRQLRTVTRRRDIVAHLGGNLFGILMPQTMLNDALFSRFSRLVALGLMADPGDPHLAPINFRIALGTFLTGALTLESFSAALIDKINQAAGWKKRSIRYISRNPRKTSDMTDMGELWQAALEQAHPNIAKPPPSTRPFDGG